MTTNRPDQDSAWARHCGEAYPHEWFIALKLLGMPHGFTRLATPEEENLITGKVTEAEFVNRSKPPFVPPSASTEQGTRPTRSDKRSKRKGSRTKGAGARFKDLSEFVRLRAAALTKAELAVWIAVFNFAQGGTATVTQAKLAKIAGTTERTIKRAVASLVQRGLLEIVERGRPGRCSVYRYLAGRGDG